MSKLREQIAKVQSAATVMSRLSNDQKNQALTKCAQLLTDKREFLVLENHKDLQEQKGKTSSSLYQRLELTAAKIDHLAQGMRDLSNMSDPCGKVLLKRELDKGLTLEQVSVPIGVIGIIFESRPDAVPQILSLVLKSGNAAVLKGGKEAKHSNQALMSVFRELGDLCPFLPADWAMLLESREDVYEMLKHEDLIDLVIPRG